MQTEAYEKEISCIQPKGEPVFRDFPHI